MAGILMAQINVGSSSGTNSDGVWDWGMNASLVMCKAHSAETRVKINDQTFTLDSNGGHYDEIPVDATKLQVMSGALDFIALG